MRQKLRQLSRALLGRRGQSFLELGFGTGDVAAYLDEPLGYRAGWIHGRFFADRAVKRRLIGWVSSRAVRGLVVILPATGFDEEVSSLLQVFTKAVRVGCPCLLVAPQLACPAVADYVAALRDLPCSRPLNVAPCAFQSTARQQHAVLTCTGVRCGGGFDDAVGCQHGLAAQAPAGPVVLGSILAEKLALWLRDGCERTQLARLWSLATS